MTNYAFKPVGEAEAGDIGYFDYVRAPRLGIVVLMDHSKSVLFFPMDNNDFSIEYLNPGSYFHLQNAELDISDIKNVVFSNNVPDQGVNFCFERNHKKSILLVINTSLYVLSLADFRLRQARGFGPAIDIVAFTDRFEIRALGALGLERIWSSSLVLQR